MERERWRRLWDSLPRHAGERDYHRQVGKTVAGRPISETQFRLIVSEALRRLGLRDEDVLLELCCGNGVITRAIAPHCLRIVALDFSAPLIEIARRDHQHPNVTYAQASVYDLSPAILPPGAIFTRVLMNDALQHFERSALEDLLRRILSVSAQDVVIVFSGVLDQRRQRRFFNTRRRRLMRWVYKITGRDLMGTWWAPRDFEAAAAKLRLRCEINEQHPDMYNSQFRVDVTFSLR